MFILKARYVSVEPSVAWDGNSSFSKTTHARYSLSDRVPAFILVCLLNPCAFCLFSWRGVVPFASVCWALFFPCSDICSLFNIVYQTKYHRATPWGVTGVRLEGWKGKNQRRAKAKWGGSHFWLRLNQPARFHHCIVREPPLTLAATFSLRRRSAIP